MKRKLINWLGLTGVVAFVSYTLAVVISPSAFPGYNWMEQAVSDLSAETAPSRMLWNQIAALYGVCSVVCATCVSIYISENKVSTPLFRIGMHLFSIMNWISYVGYAMFPLADSGKEIASFQEMRKGDRVFSGDHAYGCNNRRCTVINRFARMPDHCRVQKGRYSGDWDLGCCRAPHDDGWRNRQGCGSSAVFWNCGTFQRVCRSWLQCGMRDISVHGLPGKVRWLCSRYIIPCCRPSKPSWKR